MREGVRMKTRIAAVVLGGALIGVVLYFALIGPNPSVFQQNPVSRVDLEAIATELDLPSHTLSGYLEKLDVSASVLKGFFGILTSQNVPAENVDDCLHRMARRCKAIRQKLAVSDNGDNPQLAALRKAAREALDEGAFGRAETALVSAIDEGLRCIKQHPDGQVGCSLLTAEFKSELGDLKTIQLNDRAAARYYQEAAGLACGASDSLCADYISQSGYAWQRAGLDKEAAARFERALAIREKGLGVDHPDVATSLTDLALTYNRRGQYAEALPMFQRALKIREAALPPDHPNVAVSLDHLAFCCKRQKRYEKALSLSRRALQIYENALGPEHPDVAKSLTMAAPLYRIKGRYKEALPLFRRASTIQEKFFGPNHPRVATSLTLLAGIHYSLGHYEAALPLFKRALAIRVDALRRNHPSIGISMNNLALVYERLGRDEEALPWFRQALEILKTAMGPDHPATQSVKQSLKGMEKRGS